MNLKTQKIILRTLMAASFCAVNFAAEAQTTNDSGTINFSSFQIISQRNIFNPDRYPRTGPIRPRPNREVVPTFSLAGTMSYRKGMFAFFNGTSSEYREVLQEGGKIAGFTVAKIALDGVQLESGGKKVEMSVGAAMRQAGDGWQLSAPGEWSSSSVASETDDANSTSAETPSAVMSSGNAPNDALKRLMQQREQREQELK